jgi:phosphatidylserine/phosphatidylglycerophosphate/cardiolipin synthase-like enzyme
MDRFKLCKKNIVVSLCGLICVIAPLSSVFASEKPKAIHSAQSGCQAILLTNEDYLPALIKGIDEAQSEIFISIFSFKAGVHKNSYPDRIVGHLAKAVKRGVDVKVILEATGRLNDELNTQNRQTGKLLEEKGVKVYFDSPRTTTHTKMIVIDEKVLILGSHNLTQSALKYNNEISIMLSSPDLAKRARDYMLTIIMEAK